MMNLEYRYFNGLQTRADDSPNTVKGIFNPTESLSLDLGGFCEVIHRGAYTKTLKESPDIQAFYYHEPGEGILGSTANQTLRLSETEEGLYGEIDINMEDTWAVSKLSQVRRGDLRQASIGFSIPKGKEETKSDTGIPIRHIYEIDLYEVSIVPVGAYPETHISSRAKQELEHFGINYGELTRILFQSKEENCELPQNDIDIIKRSIDKLSSLIEPRAIMEEPVTGSNHSALIPEIMKLKNRLIKMRTDEFLSEERNNV